MEEHGYERRSHEAAQRSERGLGLKKLVEKGLLPNDFLEVASYAKEAAPWHGRSTYGGLKNGLWRSPSEFCTEEAAVELLDKAKKTVNKAVGFIEKSFGG